MKNLKVILLYVAMILAVVLFSFSMSFAGCMAIVHVTDERSEGQTPIYCHYGKGLGKVVYEYECLSTNEFLTSGGELFDASACDVWEIDNGDN